MIEKEKVREGGNLPGKPKPKPINNLTSITAKINDKIQERVKEYIQEGIKNGYNIILFHIENGELTKKPNWLGMNASNYQAKTDDLLVALSKKIYGYGVLVGKQLKDFYLIVIDMDIDTEECKERISKELEELLNKHGIRYYKEITKNKRIHYKIVLDRITNKIESISKLPYPGTCSKFKDGKKLPGEIEVLTKNKTVVSYNGFINDKEPFFTQEPVINSYIAFENFLEEWIRTFEPVKPDKEKKPKEEPKEAKDKSIKEPKSNSKTSIQRSELKEVFKTFRKYRIFNGWEGIDKLYSAYCIMENIPENQIKEDLKDIWSEEYDERLTKYLIQNTQKKYKAGSILPGLGSIYHYIREALKDDRLEEHERELLKKVLKDIENKGYSDYVLPEYLENVEDIILDYSMRQTNKDGKKYYKEGYFIVKNVKGIKKVIYVNIITPEKGGIYKSHISDGKIKEVGIKAEIVRSVQDGKITAYEFLLNDELLYKPSFNYSRLDDIINEITLKAVPYTMLFDTALYKRYLTRLIENYIEEHGKPIPCIISRQTGWSEDLRFFYHYGLNDKYHELHPDHLLYKYRKDVIKEKDKQHEIIKALLQEGKLLGLLIVASVSSLLIKPFNIPSITIVVSGNSGAGKTTSSLIATSLFYYSDEVLINALTTQTGLELTISSLNSLPVLVDEGALTGSDNSLEKLVFKASSGRGKTRGRKDLTVDFKELKSNIFWTTETTDIDNLRRTGAFRRVLNLVIKSWNDLTSLFRPEDRVNEKYSGCGVDYIRYLIEHMEDVKKAFKEETQGLSSIYNEITPIALNLYSGLILLEVYYNTKFYKQRETINKVLNDAKGLFLENKENVVQMLKDFLIANTTLRFHIVNANGVIGEKLSNRDIWGEYDANTQTYYILASSFKEIVKELGKERNLLVEELTKAGVLKGKNVSYWMKSIKQPAKVYILSFGTDKEETKKDGNVINDNIEDNEIIDF
jgi:hypothetical protein